LPAAAKIGGKIGVKNQTKGKKDAHRQTMPNGQVRGPSSSFSRTLRKK